MTPNCSFAYAQHLDVCLSGISIFVGWGKAEEPIYFNNGRGLQQGTGGVDAVG